jgi:phytanoyl-CoA hydroxylase
MNPILNLQSLNPKYFYKLRYNFENLIASNEKLANFVEEVISDKPLIVQSMYFEGNSATWEHQDSYYLDDEDIGSMIAGWVALEDIKEDAGRFFVCPKSHLFDYADMDFSNIITKNHDTYIKNIVKIVRDNKFKVKAPKLDKGDILLWNSLTIHGSLDSQSTCHSRSSITFHAIKSSSKFQVLRNISRKLTYDNHLPFNIFRPKDLSKKRNKTIFYLEKNFPLIFYRLKNMAIELKVKLKK